MANNHQKMIPAALLLLLLCADKISTSVSFTFGLHSQSIYRKAPTATSKVTSTALRAKLSPLPEGISPFEKSLSKSIDVQANFRRQAKPAVDAAVADGVVLMEIEFPPLIGGDQVRYALTFNR